MYTGYCQLVIAYELMENSINNAYAITFSNDAITFSNDAMKNAYHHGIGILCVCIHKECKSQYPKKIHGFGGLNN